MSALIHGLASRQLGLSNKKLVVPTRTFSLLGIMDQNQELMDSILIGFTPEGNHLISYKKIDTDSFRSSAYSLQFWNWPTGSQTRITKVAEIPLFEAPDLLLSFILSQDGSLITIHGIPLGEPVPCSYYVCLVLCPIKYGQLPTPFFFTYEQYVKFPFSLYKSVDRMFTYFDQNPTLLLNQGNQILVTQYTIQNKEKSAPVKRVKTHRGFWKNVELLLPECDQEDFLCEPQFTLELISSKKFDIDDFLQVMKKNNYLGMRDFDLLDCCISIFDVVPKDNKLLVLMALSYRKLGPGTNPTEHFWLSVLISIGFHDGAVQILKAMETKAQTVLRSLQMHTFLSAEKLRKDAAVPSLQGHTLYTNEGVVQGKSLEQIDHPFYPVRILKMDNPRRRDEWDFPDSDSD